MASSSSSMQALSIMSCTYIVKTFSCEPVKVKPCMKVKVKDRRAKLPVRSPKFTARVD
uniref:OJ000315_02.3 protein n=2 Tax=Oryza TaxID=4527 RepID=Q7F8W8_ORYSJ|nr:OJ000315_02.3 [Oryza sativa Japonica Group]